MISLHSVSKEFPSANGPLRVLDNVDLDVAEGLVYGIIGLSGAGKSTLVRCINALEKPTSGWVEVGGQNVSALSGHALRELRKSIGMIFQGFNLLNSRTVLHNVLLPLELAGVPRGAARERAAEMLSVVGLTDKARAYPTQLSGGQKQRVAIARALAPRPRVLLSDEATSALDPATTESILDLLCQINRKMGITMIVVTHDPGVVKRACDEMAVLEDGVVLEHGSVAQVLSKPTTDLARRFAGARLEGQAPGPGTRLLRIAFMGPGATAPVVSHLVREFGLDINILSGHIDTLKSGPFGHLLVETPASAASLASAVAWLEEQGLAVEVAS